MPKLSRVVSFFLAAVFFVFLFPFLLVHTLLRRPCGLDPRQSNPRQWIDDFPDLPLCDPHGPFKPSYDLLEPISFAAASGDPVSVRKLISAGSLPSSSKLPSAIHAACALSHPLILAELSALPKSFWLVPLSKKRIFYRGTESKGHFHKPMDSPFILLQARPDFEEALLAALSHGQWSRADASDLFAKAGLNIDVVSYGPHPPIFGKFTRLAGGCGIEVLSSELVFDEIERRRTISRESCILESSVDDPFPCGSPKQASPRL